MQHVQAMQQHGIDAEEVAGHDARCLGADKRAPRRLGPPRRGVDAMSGQDAANRTGRDSTAHTRQFSLDPLVAPSRVLSGEAHDDGLDIRGHRWSTFRRVRVGPASAHHAAMPGDQRIGRDDERRPPGPREDPTQQGQPGSVLRLEPRARLLTAKDVELVAQHEDLNLVRLAPPEAERHQHDGAAEHEIDERPQHGDLQDVTIEREAATLSTPPRPRTAWSAARSTSGTPHPARSLKTSRRRRPTPRTRCRCELLPLPDQPELPRSSSLHRHRTQDARTMRVDVQAAVSCARRRNR